MGTQLLANSIVTGSLYALVTAGFELTYNPAGFYNPMPSPLLPETVQFVA